MKLSPYLLLLASVSDCHAYLDGGTSSMLLQLIFGGVAGGLVVLKMYYRKIISYFKKEK